jgi:hypothetical protein
MNDMIQNGYTKLTKWLFSLALKRIFALCAALAALTVILMLCSVGETGFAKAYETLIWRAGIRYVFLAAVAIWMLSEAAGIQIENFRSGGAYTLMMLPTPRRNVFLAYCTRGVVCVLMLWTAQTLALLAAYVPVVALCKNAAAAFSQTADIVLPFDVARTNGLFLAVIRGDLFRILLPQSVPEATGSLLALLAAGCLPAYTLTGSLRRLNVAQGIFTACAAACVLWALGCRFDSLTRGIDITAFTASTALLALLAVGAIVDGVLRLNRDANLV